MPIVQHDVLKELSFSIFRATGIPEEDAEIVASHLATSHLKGHDSHGVWFLPRYARDMKERYVRWEDRRMVREAPALAVIDGRGANGIVAMTHAVQIAAEKAEASAVGVVALSNTTHIGRVGDYPPRIASHGMVGMVLTNVGGVFVAPFGSADRRLPPNPIALAVPRREGPPLMLDMTMSVVAGGKVEQKIVRGDPIPEGWVIDQQCSYVTESGRYRDSQQTAVLPLGGLQFGHKGHGLSMMMDMIVGPLSLAGTTKGGTGGGGIVIMAIDIESFTDMETYVEEVEQHVRWVNSARPLPGVERLYAPGEIEEETHRRRLREGIDIPEPTWAEIGAVAEELGVAMPAV